MLSRRKHTLKVSMAWEQAGLGATTAVVASMEFQVRARWYCVCHVSLRAPQAAGCGSVHARS